LPGSPDLLAVWSLPEVEGTRNDPVAKLGGTGLGLVALLSAALADVRKVAQCDYSIPQNTSVDLARLAVFIDDKSPALKLVANAPACDPKKGGFYYDVIPSSTVHPRRIILCPATCAKDKSRTIRVDCSAT